MNTARKIRSYSLSIATVLVLLVAIGWVDYKTTYEISVSGLYFIPIAYAAWRLGVGWSFSIGALCALTVCWVEARTGLQVSSDAVLAERIAMRLFVYGFVAYSFCFFRRAIESERRKVRQLEDILAVCNGCGKVRDSHGLWVSVQQFLADTEGEPPAPKLCPECARAGYFNVSK